MPERRAAEFRYRDLLFFAKFARPVCNTGMLGLVLAAAGAALGSLIPLSGKVLIDYIVMKKVPPDVERLFPSFPFHALRPPFSPESAWFVILCLLCIGIAMSILGIVKRYLLFRFEQEFSFGLQAALFEHLLGFPLSFFKKRQTGYLMSRVSDDVSVLQNLFSEGLSAVSSNLFYSFFGFAIAFALSRKLAIAALVTLPFYIMANRLYAGRLRMMSLVEREAGAGVSTHFQEVLSGVETVKAYAAEETEVKKVTRKIRAFTDARLRRMLLSLLAGYSVRGFQLLAAVVILWLGVREISTGGMSIGDFVSFASYMFLLSGSVQSLSMLNLNFQPVFASSYRLREIFGLIPEDKDIQDSPKTTGSAKGEIRFDNVSFSYGKGADVLKNISFKASPGEIIALVGESGAGKTSLVNLILKFYTPGSGSITLDGSDLRTLPARWLRRQIGVVSQDVFLFNDSIERNILYGCPGASTEEVIRAARMANIHDEIVKLEYGYRTLIGERGAGLSAGQRQRISIARAFLKNPPILILDEPSSALDAVSENFIKDSIKKISENRTIFIIAHRMASIETADKILVLENGELREMGSHEDLMSRDGLYRRLRGLSMDPAVRNAR